MRIVTSVRPRNDFHRLMQAEGGGDPCYVVDSSSNDLSLHIAAIFVLFFASALGVGIPLLPKYSTRLKMYPYLFVLGKCAGAGVMISCALVHMLLPSTEALTSECLPPIFTSYPAFSYAFALFAALASHLTEHFIEAFMTVPGADELEDQHACDHMDNGSRLGLCQTVMETDNQNSECPEILRESKITDKGEIHTQEMDNEITEGYEEDQIYKAKQFSETLVVELSLSVHSILVGLALGITFDKSFEPLFIALVFHQLLEGVALGCRLAESVLGFWNEMVFSTVFSLSCPIGIIIGISAHRTVNQTGQTFLILEGFFDGISGGILLYNGFLLLLKDFPEDMAKHCRGDCRNLKKFGMFAALWVAALGMSIIGGWA